MPEEINRLVRAENLTDNLAEVLAGKWPAGIGLIYGTDKPRNALLTIC